jgi:PD-(D/E)XK nuclease superfamily
MSLTSLQERTLDELMGRGMDRPTFRRELPAELAREIEDRTGAALAEMKQGEPLFVTKGRMADLHQRCEGLFLANQLGEGGFEYGFRLAVGKLVHKAVEVGVYARGLSEAELVERVLERLSVDDPAFGDYVGVLDPIDRAELEAEAVRLTQVFRALFPTLEKRWTPSVEMAHKVELAGGRLVLHSRPDLSLGGSDPDEPLRARRLILELKTGPDRPEHDEDVRFYALVATLFFAVPPFRVATVHLDSATWRYQDVTEDLLHSAARRVADGCARAISLLGGEEPRLRGGAWCGWCPRSPTCPSSAARG